ncbi:hypothetical protein AVEN_192050-1 [Araneus ventricosus]|uniref:BHLH domain-containing protein n=1 Tax=Araneus ventricosus TaxID=182803 RepID=A0A4Y2B9V8_ARAVE|nr:hypothetical protein AVEN_192050-1 [Araneus ventricosus]
MSMSNEYAHCPFSSSSMIPLPWVPHPSSPQSPFKLFSPQINPYSTSKMFPSPPVSELASSPVVRRKNSRKGTKPSYKHVPHKDKPPHLVARRNARERRRVEAVNSAFAKLRKCVPIENRNKRLSKVKTLHRAIEYINGLQALLGQGENPALSSEPVQHYSRLRSESVTSPDDDDDDDLDDDDSRAVKEERDDSEFHDFEEYLESDVDVVNKENEEQAWSTLSTGCESNYWTYMPYNQDYSGSIAS